MSRPLLFAALLLLSACRPDPEDLFFIVGEVIDPTSGSPITDAALTLDRNKASFCSFGAARESPYPILPQPGAAPDSGGFRTLLETQTDAQGRYLFELMRFQVTASDGRPYCLRVTAADEEGHGALSRLSTMAGPSDLQPPPLYRWAPPLAASMDEGVRVTLPALPVEPSPPYDPNNPPSATEGSSVYAYEWEIATAEDEPVWRQEATGDFSLPAEVLEDFEGKLALQLFGLTTKVNGTLFQTWDYFFTQQRAAPLTLPAGAVPASRGAPCRSNLGILDPCPVTDGDLALVSFLQQSDREEDPLATVTSEFEIDLGVPRNVRYAVIRDAFVGAAEVAVHGSNDQQVWTALGRVVLREHTELYPVYPQVAGGGDFRVMVLDRSTGPFRFIRVFPDAGEGNVGQWYGIREISLFE